MNSSKPICLVCGAQVAPRHQGLFDTRFGIAGAYGCDYCERCKTGQITPIPTESQLIEFYSKHYNYGGESRTTYTSIRQRFLNSWLYRLWLIIDGDISFHGRKGSGRLLDIGCNEGRGLQIYQHNGFKAEGLELNPVSAAAARALGFTVYEESVEQFNPQENYDVVILSNVLEHSLNPHQMLASIHKILKPGGELWISCPNYRSWLRFFFGRLWINWHVPFHIFNFTSDSLTSLVEKNGFEMLRIRNDTPALWCAHSLIATVFARPGQPTRQLRSPFLVMSLMVFFRFLLFPILWLGNITGHGDCLVAITRKK